MNVSSVEEADIQSYDSVDDRREAIATASAKLREIVQSYAKESVESKENLRDLRQQNGELMSANQVLRKREEALASVLDAILERSLETQVGEEKMQKEVEKLKTALQEIAELQEEFVSTAEEKRKHQLAMEMEIVGVVETFTDSTLLREKEKDAVEAEMSLMQEVLKKRTGVELVTTKPPASSIKPLPENLPQDLTSLFPSRVEKGSDDDEKIDFND